MLHRVLLDPIPPADADDDTAAMAETAREVERGERHLAMLAELSQIGMRLARSLGDLAEARTAAARSDENLAAHGEDAAAASFDKIALTVRRTLFLEAKLAAGLKVRREGLILERAARRAAGAEDRKNAVEEAIIEGLHDAWAATCPDEEYNNLADRLLNDAREYLGDADEMRGYLDRPVGETVARLAAALGLDPDACVPDGETWRVRRPPLDFELRLEERHRKYGAPPPSPSWGGTGCEASRVGYGRATTACAFSGESPTLTASPSVPPHKGEGGRFAPSYRSCSDSLVFRASGESR